MWMDHLRWYRALPVENGVEVLRIDLRDGLLALELTDSAINPRSCRTNA